MADAAREGGAAPLAGSQSRCCRGCRSRRRATGRCDRAGAERPSILTKLRALARQGEFPGDDRVLHDLGQLAADGRTLFKSVSEAAARYPDRYFALSAIASPECNGAMRRRGSNCSRILGGRCRCRRRVRCAERIATPPLPVPPVPACRPCRGPHRRARGEADSRRGGRRSSTSGSSPMPARPRPAVEIGERLVLRSSRPTYRIKPRWAASCSMCRPPKPAPYERMSADQGAGAAPRSTAY